MLTIFLCLICVCQATQETAQDFLTDPNEENDKVEVFSFNDVEYLFFGYQVTFDEASVICLNYKAQLAVLNSKEKTDFVTRAMTNTFELEEFWIGARSDKENSWYWIDKNQKLNLDHTFYGYFKVWNSSGFVPGDSRKSNHNCLTIYRERHSIPTFIPLQCSKTRLFICQREIDRFGIKTKEVDVIKVDDEEYTLYSAKATWAEAVVLCRQKGLQIAEVKSRKAGQSVAMSMIRARPDAMENVWIGGYLKDSVWEWVASSEEITANELWSNDSKLSTGCLLLDRHVCEDPIYVSANCDRRRHILCQKRSMKSINKNPIPIDVDGCPYWIGFYPLKWLDARRSCQAINASLVILDSPKIINHMMTLMADYKQELRHIWTDGYRTRNNTISGEEINQEIWYWSTTGDRIPESDFIPWCAVCDNTKKTNCLNLDRENHKTPIVYGLSCRKNQAYICQPWKGHCVPHRLQEDLLKNSELLNLYSSLADMKPVKTPAIALSQNSSRETEENVSYVYEDISNMKKFHSTESYYTSSVSYSTSQQVTYLLEKTIESTTTKNSTRPSDKKKKISDPTNQRFLNKGKSGNIKKLERIKPTEMNQISSQNMITEFFSPLIEFTLPSLPQFGIKMVNAEVISPKPEVKKVSSENFTPEESTKSVASLAKMAQNTKGKNRKISSTGKSKNHGSMFANNSPKTKSKKPVAVNKVNVQNLSTTPSTTENVSSGGLYGNDNDYYNVLSSKATDIIEKKEPNYDYEDISKSLDTNETLSSLAKTNNENSIPNVNVSAILKKVLDEELKLMKKSQKNNDLQKTLMDFSVRKSFKNIYPGSTSEPKEEFKNKEISQDRPRFHDYILASIPPYYGFESPLKMELLDDGTGVSLAPILPAFTNFNQNDNSEKAEKNLGSEPPTTNRLETNNESHSSLDSELAKLDPYDKNSMLKLGRFLKNMFVGINPNAQTVDVNLIARKNLPEAVMHSQNNQSLIEKNYVQRDTNAQNEDYTRITANTIANSTLQPANENQDSPHCQKELSNVKRSKPSSKLCKELPVLVPAAPFRIPRMSSDMSNEQINKNINQKSVEQNVEENIEKSLFSVFKDLVKGIRIDIKETQLKDYVIRFVRERLPNPEEYDFSSGSGKSWHKAFKKILNSLNGTAIRFHGERVQLRLGSFGYKKKKKLRPIINLVTQVRKLASPVYNNGEVFLKLQGSQTRDGSSEDQVQVQRIPVPLSLPNAQKAELEEQHSKESIGILNNTQNDNQYSSSPPQSKTDSTNQNSQSRPIKNKLNIKRTRQKITTEAAQFSEHVETQRWPYVRNEREKLKKMKEAEDKEMPGSYRDLPNRALDVEENLKNVANGDSLNDEMQKLQTGNKLSKKSISIGNEENPFPDFPVINFDMKRAEDSFENGFEPIRIGRAAKHDEDKDQSSLVSVYIVLKHLNNSDTENSSTPILELHVRMPADSTSLEVKSNFDSKIRSISNEQVSDSEVLNRSFKNSVPQIQRTQTSLEVQMNDNVQMTQEPLETQKIQSNLKSQKLRKPKIPKRKKAKNRNHLKNAGLRSGKNHTDLNYDRANDLIRNIIENVTNYEDIPNLKRKRQLLYLALKYFKYITDDRLKKQSREIEDNSRYPITKEDKEKNRSFSKHPISNSNLRVQVIPSEVKNTWQPIIYPGLENRPVVFNPIENELNLRSGVFNQMPNFNYNTRRYDDMPYRPVNSRIRRSLELPKNSRSGLFFVDKQQELNRNQKSNT